MREFMVVFWRHRHFVFVCSRTHRITITNFCLGKHLVSEEDLLKDQRGSPAPACLLSGPWWYFALLVGAWKWALSPQTECLEQGLVTIRKTSLITSQLLPRTYVKGEKIRFWYVKPHMMNKPDKTGGVQIAYCWSNLMLYNEKVWKYTYTPISFLKAVWLNRPDVFDQVNLILEWQEFYPSIASFGWTCMTF